MIVELNTMKSTKCILIKSQEKEGNNMAHTNKLAKSLLWMKDDPRIRSIHMEDSSGDDGLGNGEWSYWIYTRGLHYDGLHAIHAPTAKDVLERLSMMEQCSEDCDCWDE